MKDWNVICSSNQQDSSTPSNDFDMPPQRNLKIGKSEP